MKKTYRKFRKYRKMRKSYKLHKSRKVQRGGTYGHDYELKISSDLNTVFITSNKTPRILYKIDLPSKKFTKFTTIFPHDSYPLEKKFDNLLFHILSDAKRNDTTFDKLLMSHEIDNIEYYPYNRFYIPVANYIPNKYKHVLHEIKEVEEENLKRSPIQVVKELPLSPRSPNSKTMRRNRRKESIVAAMKFADVAPRNNATSSDKPKRIIRVTPQTSSKRKRMPDLGLSKTDSRRSPFKP